MKVRVEGEGEWEGEGEFPPPTTVWGQVPSRTLTFGRLARARRFDYALCHGPSDGWNLAADYHSISNKPTFIIDSYELSLSFKYSY